MLNVNQTIKPIAFYLPQFHCIRENDEWWGQGFTDWITVKNASALYENHNQPQYPLDNNYYDLLDPNTLKWQSELADKYGVYGFCFYHYYFKDGRKVLEKPSQMLLSHKEIPMRFCFSWANETWARTWAKIKGANDWSEKFEHQSCNGDGILLLQEYGEEKQWRAHFDYLLPFFKDDRYIKFDNQPVFVIHKPDDIICLKQMMICWDKWAKAEGFNGIYTIGRNTEKTIYTKAMLYQGPAAGWNEKITKNPIRWYKRGDVVCGNYSNAWNNILLQDALDNVDTYFGGFVDYDETPRKGYKGIVADGATPELFEKYLRVLALKNKAQGNEFLFINAWNEWGEGNHLEPDQMNGYRFLEGVKRTVDFVNGLNDYAGEWRIAEHNLIIETKANDVLTNYCMDFNNERLVQYKECFYLMSNWRALEEKGIVVADILKRQNYRKIAIYGWGKIGEHFYNSVKDSIDVVYIVDRARNTNVLPVYRPDDSLPDVDVIVITVVHNRNLIADELKKKLSMPVITLVDLIDNCMQKTIQNKMTKNPKSIYAREFIGWIITQYCAKRVLDIESGSVINLFHIWRDSFFNKVEVDNYSEDGGLAFMPYNHVYKEIGNIVDNYDFVLFVDTFDYFSSDNLLKKIDNLKEKTRFFLFCFPTGTMIDDNVINRLKSLGRVKTSTYNGGFLLMVDQYTSKDGLYVVSHKEETSSRILGNKVIHVGKPNIASCLQDSTLDNISVYNPYINECTALYWIWRNTKTEIVGIYHYRRFLSLGFEWDDGEAAILDTDLAGRILDKYDFITIDATFVPEGLNVSIINTVDSSVYFSFEEQVERHILQVSPEYYDLYKEVMNGYYFYPCNIFVTKWKNFDSYCKWLFSIILPVCAHYSGFNNLNNKQKRTLGYIAERMLTVYILHNKLKVYEYPMLLL